MNHIARITNERDEARETIRNARELLTDIELYLTSSKFAAPDADYVHVRTDILPKIARARFALIQN
jgi:hypothetical protein